MKHFHKNLEFDIPEGVYEPREDSELLAEALKKILKNEKPKTVLDMGCGSGLLGIIAAKSGSTVVCADINPKAVECAKGNSQKNGVAVEFIVSDLFDNISFDSVSRKKNVEKNCVQVDGVVSDLFDNVSGKFDLIIFNPPYLPTNDKIEGKEMWQNNNTIEKFLTEAGKYLSLNGKILLLVSSLTKQIKFEKYNFSVEIIAGKKLPWEEIFVLKLSR